VHEDLEPDLTIVQKINEIHEEVTKPGTPFSQDNDKHKAIIDGISGAGNAIKSCAESGQECDGLAVGKAVLDLASTVMMAASVLQPAGPLIAMLGSLILEFAKPKPGEAPKPLTIDDVKSAVKVALEEFRMTGQTYHDLPALRDTLLSSLQQIIDAATGPDPYDFKQRYLPDISQDLKGAAFEMMKIHNSMFGTESSLTTARKAMILSTSCKNECKHDGHDWQNSNCWENKANDWNSLRNAMKYYSTTSSMFPAITGAVTKLYELNSWDTNDNDFKQIQTAIQTAMNAGLLLDQTIMSLRQIAEDECKEGGKNVTDCTIAKDEMDIKAGNQFIRDYPGPYFSNENYLWENRDKVLTNYVELIRVGLPPFCGDNPAGWCNQKGGFEYIASLVYGGNEGPDDRARKEKYMTEMGGETCQQITELFFNSAGGSSIKYAYALGAREDLQSGLKLDWGGTNLCFAGDSGGLWTCQNPSRSGVCARKEACAPDAAIEIIQNDDNFLNYAHLSPKW